MVVVLPAPFGPEERHHLPAGTENVTSRTARNVPNCLESPRASIITGVDMPSSSSHPTGNWGLAPRRSDGPEPRLEPRSTTWPKPSASTPPDRPGAPKASL